MGRKKQPKEINWMRSGCNQYYTDSVKEGILALKIYDNSDNIVAVVRTNNIHESRNKASVQFQTKQPNINLVKFAYEVEQELQSNLVTS